MKKQPNVSAYMGFQAGLFSLLLFPFEECRFFGLSLIIMTIITLVFSIDGFLKTKEYPEIYSEKCFAITGIVIGIGNFVFLAVLSTIIVLSGALN